MLSLLDVSDCSSPAKKGCAAWLLYGDGLRPDVQDAARALKPDSGWVQKGCFREKEGSDETGREHGHEDDPDHDGNPAVRDGPDRPPNDKGGNNHHDCNPDHPGYIHTLLLRTELPEPPATADVQGSKERGANQAAKRIAEGLFLGYSTPKAGGVQKIETR